MTDRLDADPLQAYRVGGYVRDTLLGRQPKDCDWVVVGHTAPDMLARGFKPVGRDFPVFLHPITGEEYALARIERKTGPGYRGFDIHAPSTVTLEEDLQRRDFTINAIAMDDAGRLIDPFGGQGDLAAGILRHIGPAFVDDPVRLLRGARLAADYGLSIATETLQLMHDMVSSGEVDALTPERVWVELVKALGGPRPDRFIEILQDTGALRCLFPELAALHGVPQPEIHHPEIDTLLHVRLALQQACLLTDDPLVRFAVLVHDLGKGATPVDEWPHHRGHEAAGVPLVRAICARYKAPSAYSRLAELVCRHHLEAHRALQLRPATLLNLFERLDALRRPDSAEGFLLACEADARGRLGLAHRDYPQARYLRAGLTLLRDMPTRQFIEAGLRGARLGEQLRKARLARLRELRRDWPDTKATRSTGQ